MDLKRITSSLLLLAGFSAGAQEISFTALANGALPGIGEIVYDSASDRFFVASGSTTIQVIDQAGTLDNSFAGDGIFGNDVTEQLFTDAEYLAFDGSRLFVVDQQDDLIYVINPADGTLDTGLGTDGIIGNDPGEPDFTGQNLHDIEVFEGVLYIANDVDVLSLTLDGNNTLGTLSDFGAQMLAFGPHPGSGNCQTNAFTGDQALYMVQPNTSAVDGTPAVACAGTSGPPVTILQVSDISLTDLTFGDPIGATCNALPLFSDNTIAYIAQRDGLAEIRCLGSDGSTAEMNDANTPAGSGIAMADSRLFLREATGDGEIFRSASLNEFAPVIAAQNTTIDENTASGTLFMPVATDQDPSDTLSGWAIVGGNTSNDGDADLPFDIDPATGEISINDVGDLNREAVASFDLQVTVSDGQNTSAATTFTVNLNDINEFVPQVDVGLSTTRDEGLALNALVFTATGSDDDATAVLQDWAIVGGNDDISGNNTPPFFIDADDGEIRINDPDDFDRELTTGFTLQVTVGDGLNTSAPQNVIITLNDVNEFIPQVNPGLAVTQDENLGANALVATATATDGDATAVLQNWAIVSGNDDISGNAIAPFLIIPGSGEIRINDPADFNRELTDQFVLQVTVSDGLNTSPAETVIINLNDVNEFTPIVDPGQSVTMDEGLALNELVIAVNANDDDATAELQDWAIVGGNDDVSGNSTPPFFIDPDDGEIRINDPDDFDFELIEQFLLQVTVSDGDNTSLPETVTINLNDVNDIPPEITAGQAVTRDEGLAQNSLVITATATDDDTNSVLQDWTIISGNDDISGNSTAPFIIDPDSGQIRINDPADFDRELIEQFVLELTVSDGDNTSQPETLTITLNDINESAPVIDPGQTANILEGSPFGTPVLTITANDEDATAQLQDWMIIGGNDDLDLDGVNPFDLDPTNGLLTVNDSDDLDTKKAASFTLSITVGDGDQTSSPELITIIVDQRGQEVAAIADRFFIDEGTNTTVAAPGVLMNDLTANNVPLSVDQVSGLAANVGVPQTLDNDLVVTLFADGRINFDASQIDAAPANGSLISTMSYRATDGTNTDIALITIIINGDNDPPVAQADTFQALEDQRLNGNVLVDNGNGPDSDPDLGNSLSVTSIGTFNANGIGGTVQMFEDGTFRYSPPADQSGTADFDYTVTDGTDTSSATVTINVAAVNDAPGFTAGPNQFQLPGTSGSQLVGGWAQDIDPGPNEDGQTVQFNVTPTSDPDNVVSAISIAANGDLDYTLTGSSGLARFQVTLMDDGGTADGGQDSSQAIELIIATIAGVELESITTDNRLSIENGEQTTYTISIVNNGTEDAVNATVVNNVPAELTGATWTCTASGGATCAAAGSGNINETVSIPVNAEVVFELTATVSAAQGVIMSTATAQAGGGQNEILPENDSDTDTTVIGEMLFSDGFEAMP